MSRDITIVLKVQDSFSQPLQQFNTQIGGVTDSTKGLTNASTQTGGALDGVTKAITGGIVAWAGWKGINAVSDMFQLGQQVNITSSTFSALTSGIGGSVANLQALRQETGGVVDDMTLMEGSAKMLQMGIAANTDELTGLMSMATKLGSSMGMSVDKSLSDFSLMLANNSILRLDQFGIASGRVREEMERLADAFPDMDKSERFKLAVLKEGAGALDRLGSAAQAAETPLNRVATSVKNLVDSFSANFSTGANSLVGIIQVASGTYPGQAENKSAAETLARNQAADFARSYFGVMQDYIDMSGASKASDGFVSKLLFETAEAVRNNPNLDVNRFIADAVAKGWQNGEAIGPQDVQGYIDSFTATFEIANGEIANNVANQQYALKKQLLADFLAGDSGRDWIPGFDVFAGGTKDAQAREDADKQSSMQAQRESLAMLRERKELMDGIASNMTGAFGSMGYDTSVTDPSLFSQKLDPEYMKSLVPTYMEQGAADQITRDYRSAQDELRKLHDLADKKLISDEQLTASENMVDNLGAMADQAQAAADAFKNLTIAQATGQSGGGMKGELTDMVIQNMKDKGYGKNAIEKMQQELDLASGRQTSSSLEIEQVIAPMIAKMTAKQAAQAIANVDAFLKEATLQGLSQEQITAMLPEVVGFDQQNNTRKISQKEIDAQRKKWEEDHKQEKKRNKDGTYDYTGRWLDDMGKEAFFTPDPNQMINYTTFTGGMDFSSQQAAQNYINSYMGYGGMSSGSKMFGDISGMDEAAMAGGTGGAGGKKSPTTTMATDMAHINKDSAAIDKSTKAIAESTTAAAKAATIIKDALNNVPDSVAVVFRFTADDPQGLVGMVKGLMGGTLTLGDAVRANGGSVPGATGGRRSPTKN